MDLSTSWELAAIVLNKSSPMGRVQCANLPGSWPEGYRPALHSQLSISPVENLSASASESEKREDGPAFYAVTSFLLVKNEVQGKLWTLNPSN